MAKKPVSPRAARRAAERARDKLLEQRARLARLEPGGAPDRPIDVASAAVVESRAEAEPCLRCGQAVRAVDHRADTIDGRRVRIVVVRCPRCGYERTMFVSIGTPLPS